MSGETADQDVVLADGVCSGFFADGCLGPVGACGFCRFGLEILFWRNTGGFQQCPDALSVRNTEECVSLEGSADVVALQPGILFLALSRFVFVFHNDVTERAGQSICQVCQSSGFHVFWIGRQSTTMFMYSVFGRR